MDGFERSYISLGQSIMEILHSNMRKHSSYFILQCLDSQIALGLHIIGRLTCKPQELGVPPKSLNLSNLTQGHYYSAGYLLKVTQLGRMRSPSNFTAQLLKLDVWRE
jgi:hypothetical protein